MKTLKKNRFLLVVVLTVFALVSAILGLSAFGKKTALAEDAASETFVMEDGVSAKLSNGGGIRFRVKMDETTGASVQNGESNLQIVIAPYYYFNKGVDFAIQNGRKIDVVKEKVYQEDGAYYANGCITDIKEANRKLNLQAIAVISSGETVTKQTAVNANAKGNMYDVLTSAVLDANGDYEKTIFAMTAYNTWFGTETYPITVLNDTEYAALVAKLAGGEDGFKDKYYRIIKTVSGYNADDFNGISEHVELFKAANAVTFADGSMDITYPATPSPSATAKGGDVTFKYTAAKIENDQLVKVGEPGDWNSVYSGAGIYCCIASTEGDDTYEAATAEKYFTVFKASNAISEITVANITHGETPAPANITATYGTPVITYANADKTVSGEWEKVYTKPGMYWCIATVAEGDSYQAASSEKPFTVLKLENEITLDGSLDCTYGSGPNEIIATATDGTPVYTYWLANEDDWGGVTEPGTDAKFKPWSECDKVGVYKCRITVAESDYYYATRTECWVRVHKKEADENGVKYTYADGSYGVSGYVGSNTTVTVAEMFNDGANGEAAVTHVASGADWGSTVKKIILHAGITDFKGNSFQLAENLEYISMTGVKELQTVNNFINNTKIITVIVNKDFKLNNQQFKKWGVDGDPTVVIYVDGKKSESTFSFTMANNEFLTGIVYYKVDDDAEAKCLQWKFDDNGEMVTGPSAHNYVDGVCDVCGEKDAMGVVYKYNSDTNSYYVAGYTGSATEITVFDTWNDGENGEAAVTYVAEFAFSGNGDLNSANYANCQNIKKVVFPASVKELKSSVFNNCYNLEYVDMRGVTTLSGNNNFLNCDKLATVIIGDGYHAADQQFVTQNGSLTPVLNLYVYGTTEISLSGNDKLVKSTYYFSATESAGAWHFDENGVPTLW